MKRSEPDVEEVRAWAHQRYVAAGDISKRELRRWAELRWPGAVPPNSVSHRLRQHFTVPAEGPLPQWVIDAWNATHPRRKFQPLADPDWLE